MNECIDGWMNKRSNEHLEIEINETDMVFLCSWTHSLVRKKANDANFQRRWKHFPKVFENKNYDTSLHSTFIRPKQRHMYMYNESILLYP